MIVTYYNNMKPFRSARKSVTIVNTRLADSIGSSNEPELGAIPETMGGECPKNGRSGALLWRPGAIVLFGIYYQRSQVRRRSLGEGRIPQESVSQTLPTGHDTERFRLTEPHISVYTVMTTTVLAHFDGKHSLVLDEPVDLPTGTPLRVHVEPMSANAIHSAGPSDHKVTPAPRRFQPLDIQIEPRLSHSIALDPEFGIEES